MPRTLRLSPMLDLKFFHPEGELVAFNVGADGFMYFVFALKKLDYRFKKGLGDFSKTVPDESQCYRVLIARDNHVKRDIVISNEMFNIHEVQPLPGNELLLVCGRSFYRGAEDFDR